MKTHNRIWSMVIVLGWTAMLFLAAYAAHHGGWHHAWRQFHEMHQ